MLAPSQIAGLAGKALTVREYAGATVTVPIAVHPFASVTVTVYVPLHALFGFVRNGFQAYVYGGVPPVTFGLITPSHELQLVGGVDVGEINNAGGANNVAVAVAVVAA